MNKLTELEIETILTNEVVDRDIVRLHAKDVSKYCADNNNTFDTGCIQVEDLKQEIYIGLLNALRDYEGRVDMGQFLSDPSSTLVFRYLSASAKNKKHGMVDYYLAQKRNLFVSSDGEDYLVGISDPFEGVVQDYDRESGEVTFVTPELPKDKSDPVTFDLEASFYQNGSQSDVFLLLDWIKENCETVRTSDLNKFSKLQASKDLDWSIKKLNETIADLQEIVNNLK